MNRVGLGLLLALLAGGLAQAVTVQEIIDGNAKVQAGINDFSCLMSFSISSPSVRVPETRVKLYYKAPDRFKPEAVDGDFTVLPKTYRLAVGNILARLAKHNHARLLGEEEVNDRPCWRLKLTPKEPDTGVLYHLIEVDQERFTVSRIRTYPNGEQPVTLTLTQSQHGRAWLPATATIEALQKTRHDDQLEQVRVVIKFTKYRTNLGLSDDFFKDPEE